MALKKIIALTLIFALCISCLAGCARKGEISTENPPDISDQAPAFVEKEDLYLYIRDNIVYVNEYTEMPITVLYGDQVTGPIEIRDDRGQTLATLENDGSGRIETILKMTASQERVGYLSAVCGEIQSTQATFYVQPHVTDEMMESTMDTGMQLLEHLDTCGIDDPYSRETLDIVVEWLNANESVTDVVDTGSGILYTTTAGLACGYGFGNISKDAAGSAYENATESVEMDTEFSELEDVYNAWLENEDVRGKFVKSDVAITNRNILSLTLDTYEDLFANVAVTFDYTGK